MHRAIRNWKLNVNTTSYCKVMLNYLHGKMLRYTNRNYIQIIDVYGIINIPEIWLIPPDPVTYAWCWLSILFSMHIFTRFKTIHLQYLLNLYFVWYYNFIDYKCIPFLLYKHRWQEYRSTMILMIYRESETKYVIWSKKNCHMSHRYELQNKGN